LHLSSVALTADADAPSLRAPGWLLSAIACLAFRPGALQRCFLTRELHPLGRYTVRLWDAPAKVWREVTVSDEVPCARDTGKPLFTQPKGNELWVLILEKAFAKFIGTYAALEGGHALFALEALTGDHVMKFFSEDGGALWRRYNLTHFSTPGAAPAAPAAPAARKKIGLSRTEEAHSHGDAFAILRTYAARRSVIGAGSGRGADTKAGAKRGIVQGHCYAVLRVVDTSGLRLLQLRNPWGSFEWTGPWSDNAPEWDRYPSVKKELRGAAAAGTKDDGTFWMDWDDFVTEFSQLDVCHRSTGVDDLAIDLHEEEGCMGPALGCVGGCADYWCCCAGCRALCCAVESSSETVSGKARC
jgi:calpain-15